MFAGIEDDTQEDDLFVTYPTRVPICAIPRRRDIYYTALLYSPVHISFHLSRMKEESRIE